MQNDTLEKATMVLTQKRRRRIWYKVISVLACIVVFCTTYALILPAITIEKTAYCGIEPHQHTEECYGSNLICEKEEHDHTLGCYSNPEADVESPESWAQNISQLELTGSYRSDLIAVAESQLGYTESSQNYTVSENGETKNGYTRYGAWYGLPYGDWCAMFVSFCLHYADIPTERFPQEADCSRWVDQLRSEEYGLYLAAADGYEPKVGDLIFFDQDGDGASDHMGIMTERIEDEQGALTEMKTIEGNLEDQVKYATYPISDETILGYAVLPNGPNEASSDPMTQTFTGEDDTVAVEQANPAQAGTVEGITPNGTVINLFDYWLIDRVSTHEGGDLGEGNKSDNGINEGHTLKFTPNGFGDLTNKWTGNASPRAGIVANRLGGDGYPTLTQWAADNSGTDDKDVQSLAYLFNPTIVNDYKKAFRNVGGLLQIDEDGYYYYDCQKNFAEFNEDTGKFTLYDTWGVKSGGDSSKEGQFFPFNRFAEVQGEGITSRSAEINHYFGMTMTSRFVQRYGGHTNASRRTATIFDFAGDDDVWIFIDGVLIGDLGGIHDKASVNIDFATGDVIINGNKSTTLKEAFEFAGVETTDDEWNGNTFADNTYHTLKFYYLERGNYESNMMLKYNLNAVPETSIYKTDQYGRSLANVEFEVYKANEAWEYDETKPVYRDTTNGDGELTFVDEDKMPYTLKELKGLFGEYCVLKETKAPPGYRLVSTEVHLHISDTALWCDNTYDSGVWAMVTLQVAAPTTLQLMNGSEQEFYEFDNETSKGTLFGVVVKRVGTGEIGKRASWAPVSGNSKDGYVVHPAATDEEFIKEGIRVAKEKGTVFKMAPSGAMELEMTDLPGKITEYYYMLGSAEKDKAKFTTAYYWTSADSLEGATAENTFRVNSDAMAPHAFDRTFGAKIEVPNLGNRLIVQKFDEDNQLIDGAIFALFKANEDGTYIADDGSQVTLEEIQSRAGTEVHFDSNNDNNSYAVITLEGGRKITSVEQRRTNSEVLENTPGTCVFGIREKALNIGCYYLWEVQAPVGYQINTTPIMVRVTESAIYANAGTADDGVKVARGPGYISSTLHKAASLGDVDRTLTWLYQKLRVSGVSTSFTEAVPNSLDDWQYAKNEAGLELASYLYYTRTPQQLGANRFLANYIVDKENERPVIEGTVRTRQQQIATDVGWSYNEIYQDYQYGIRWLTENGSSANYTDLSAEGDISNLFSRSVYVQVRDERIFSDLEIRKTVTNAPQGRSDEFTFTVTIQNETGTYDYDIYNISDRDMPVGSGTISSGGTITLKDGQIAVIQNLPVYAKYTVTEMPVSFYDASYSIDGADAVVGFEASGTLNWVEGENGNRVSRVAFTNNYTPPLDLTLKKYATGTDIPLNGAKFVLYTVTENTTYYYDNGNWTQLSDEKTLESLACTTGADGTIVFMGIPDGTYALKETKAPDGYYLMDTEITFTVTGGKIVTESEDHFTEISITVYNNAGHELPQTGGTGTQGFAIAGLLLTTTAGMLLLYKKKKRRKKDIVSS